MLIIFVNILFHSLFPIKQIISTINYLGIFLFILGWVPQFWIYFKYKKEKNSIETKETPNVLITYGLFRISRNPNYFGMVVSLFGEAIFLGSLITFILPAIFFILINIFNIPFEEKVLEKKFGKKYLDYKKKVRRWI